METKHSVPSKALSLFLSVLMAVSCFSIVLPFFAPKALAAEASEKQWRVLTDAFEVAYNAGHFTTAGYAVSVSGTGVTVEDNTTTGYYYNIVRALADVAAAETDCTHNASLRATIKAKLAEKLGTEKYTNYMGNFVDELFPVPTPEGTGYAQADGVYGWNEDNCWQGSAADAANFGAVTYTVTAKRSAKAAVLSDYENAADVPAQIQTEYKLTINAKPYTGAAPEGSAFTTLLWYQNDTLTVAAGTAAAPDLSKIVAYNAYVNGTGSQTSSALFKEVYDDYVSDADSIYQRTSAEIRSFQPEYQPLMTAANGVDGDFVEKFIGVSNMQAYTAFVTKCYNSADTTDVKAYVDWIQGVPINDPNYAAADSARDYSISYEGEDFYRNSRQYNGYTEDIADFNASVLNADDAKVMLGLVELAKTYRNRINAQSASVIANLTAQYGYDTGAYDAYIADMQTRIASVKVADIKDAYNFISGNSAPSTYTFRKNSEFYTAETYSVSDDTAVDGEKVYYTRSDEYSAVAAPTADDMATYYERSGDAEPYTYTLTADTAPVSGKTYYYVSGDKYTKVATPTGNPHTAPYYEYTPAAKIMAFGNDSFYSQYYTEAGQESPMSDEELLATYNWLVAAYGSLNALDTAARNIYFTDADMNQMSTYIDALKVEKAYRGFVGDHDNYGNEYHYFLDLILNVNPNSLSDTAIHGQPDDPATTDEDESVEGLIAEATRHYNSLVTAFNNVRGSYSTSIQNRYSAFNTKAYNYISNLYKVLYERCYNDLADIVKAANGSVSQTGVGSWGSVTNKNFAAVKGAIGAFDQADWEASQFKNGETDKPVAVNERYTWVTNNWGTIASRAGLNNNHYNTLTGIVGHIMTYKTQCDEKMSGGWSNISTNRNSNSSWDNFTGTYTTRNALKNDMARYLAFDGASSQRYEYTVTNTKIETVITKLDTFLKSDSFIKLIGMYDDGVTDLSSFIENLLVEKLFTDKIVNTLIALLLPMVCDMLETKINELLSDLVIDGVHCSQAPHSGWSAGLKIQNILDAAGMGTKIYTGSDPWGDWTNVGAGVKNLAGWGDIAFNGAQSTTTFPNEFENLGLNIYPQKFGSHLTGSVNGLNTTTFKNALNTAGSSGKRGGGWWYFDTYNQHYFQRADGSWYTDNSRTRDGYNDGEITADDLAGIQWGCKDFNTFVNALAAVFSCIEPLIKCLFTNMTYQRTTSNKFIKAHVEATGDARAQASKVLAASGGVELKADGYGQATLTIAGLQGYNNLWAPIFEAMGVTGTTSGYGVTTSAPWSTSLGTAGSSPTSTQVVNALFMPVYSLVHTLAQNPIATLCNILPNLCYALSYNLVQPLINQLSLNVNLKASIIISDIGKLELWGWADFDWLASLFVDKINDALDGVVDTGIPLDLSTFLKLNDLLGADITNLNALLTKFLKEKAAAFPAINTAFLGTLGTKVTKTSIRTADYNSGPGAGSRYYVEPDKADVLYDILKFVLDLAATPGALGDLLTGFGVDSLPDSILSLVENIEPEDAIAALVELFLPRGISGSGYSTGYDMATYDWYTPNTSGRSNYTFSQGSFVYLKYANDWSREKAEYIYNNVDDVVNDLLENFGGETFAGYEGINEWLLATVNSMFTNEGIMNVLEIFEKLHSSTESEEHTISQIIKEQVKINGASLGVDFRAWYNSFGYLYGENRVLGTYEKEVDGVKREFTEYVYLPEESNGFTADYLVGYNKNQFKTAGEEGYGKVEMEFIRTYPLAPSGFSGFTKAAGEWLPSGGQGAYGSVTHYYKASTDTANDETVWTWTLGKPDTSYTSVFPNLKVTVNSEPDENDCWYTWQVKGNSYTAPFGIANGTWVTLVDGSSDKAGSEYARQRFTAVFCALMEPIMSLMSLILTANDLTLFNNAITIKGYNCYDGAIIPVMEMLGVTGLKTQAQYSADYKITGSSDLSKGSAGFYYLCQKLFDALTEILTDDSATGGKTPIQKVIELLPNLFYFLQSDGITTLLKNLLMPVWVLIDTIRPIADADLDDFVHQFLCNMLGLVYDKSSNAAYTSTKAVDAILELTGLLDFIPYNATQAAKDKQMVDAIYTLSVEKLDLESIKKIIELFTKQDDGTYFDLSPLTYAFEGMCYGYTYNGVTYGVQTYDSSYTAAGISSSITNYSFYSKARTLKYYGPDIVTVTIEALLDLIRYKDNAKVLDAMIGLVGESTQLKVGDVSAAGILESLDFIFKAKDDTSVMRQPNWDYLLEDGTKAVRRPQDGYAIAWVDGDYDKLMRDFSDMSAYHTIYTLAYKTDWTYETAASVDTMLSGILDYLTTAFIATEDDEITSFSDFIGGILEDNLFNGDILKVIAGLMAKLYNLIPASTVALIDNLVDINMTGWLDAGYIATGAERFYEEDVLGNSVMEYDFNGDGEITENEQFFRYVVKVNGAALTYDKQTVKPTAYSFHIGDKVTKQEYCFDSAYNYVAKKDEDNNDIISYYIAAGTFNDGYKTDEAGSKVLNSVNYFSEADETWAVEDGIYNVNYNFGWWNEAADQTAHPYVDTQDEFMAAVNDILQPCAKLFAFIFLNKGYKYLYTEGNSLNGAADSDDTDAIILDGIGAYKEAIIPILEALGVPLTTAQYDNYVAMGRDMSHYERKNYSDAKYQALVSGNNWDNAASVWTSDMVEVFSNLILTIINDPVNWILDNLANVIYFVNAGGFTACIANLFDDIQEVLNAVNGLLDEDERLSQSNLAGIDLTNLTLAGILDMVAGMGIAGTFHIKDEFMAYLQNLFVGTIRAFDSANGNVAFRMDCNTEEDRADLLTILISVLVEIIEDSGYYIDKHNNYNYTWYSNPAAIDRLIDRDLEDGETGMVEGILNTLKNPADIVYADLDWDYFKEDYDLAGNTSDNGSVTVPGFAFQYLSYGTQWTYSKALTTATGLEELVNSVLGMLGVLEEGQTIADLINIDTIFTGETLQGILDLVAPLLYGEDAVLGEALLNTLGLVLGADLTSWNYKYAFAGEDAFTDNGYDVETLATETETGLKYVADFPAYEWKYVATEDTEIDASKDYYTKDGKFVKVAAPAADKLGEYYELSFEFTEDEELTEGKTYYRQVVSETDPDDIDYAVIGTADLDAEEIGTYFEAVYTLTADTAADGAKTYYEKSWQKVAEPAAADLGTYSEYVKVATGETMKTYLVNDDESFAAGLTLFLEPAYRLLAWILFDEGYEFFQSSLHPYDNDPLITLQGAEGYKKSLALLLEAFGCKNLAYASKYEQIRDAAMDEGDSKPAAVRKMMASFTKDLISSIVIRLKEIAADPINEIIELIPELIYFINAGGLGVTVNNLLAGLLGIVENTPAIAGLILDDIYVLTADTEIVEGHKYFTKNADDSFTEVLNPVASDLASYYVIDKAEAGNVVNDLVSGLLNDALADYLADGETIEFSLEGINLKFVFTLAEKITGLKINSLLQNSLDKFYMGKVTAYASKSEINPAYKMSFDKSFSKSGNGDFADFVTILLTFIIDIALYQEKDADNNVTFSNAGAIMALVNGDKTAADDGYIDPSIIDAIIKFIKDGYTEEVVDIDWLYFDDAITSPEIVDNGDDTFSLDGEVLDYNTTVTLNGRTINYLNYASDWTEDLASYVVDNRNEIIADVLSLIGIDGTIADAIKDVFDPATDLYTAETLNSIFFLVKDLTDSLPSAILDIVGVILDVDLSYYKNNNGFYAADTYVEADIDEFADGVTYYTADEAAEGAEQTYTAVAADAAFDAETEYYTLETANFTDGSRQLFVDALVNMLTPLNVILDWLLFGKDIKYFDKIEYSDLEGHVQDPDSYQVLISLQGANGYKYGLVPLLEALGVTCPNVGADDTTSDLLPVIVNNALARVEAILANPVDEILALLPELIYFINANGLSAAIQNLLGGVIALINQAGPALGSLGVDATDANSLLSSLLADLGLEIDLDNLDLKGIFTMVEGMTKVEYTTYAKADSEFDADAEYYVLNAEESTDTDKVYTKVDEPAAADFGTYYTATVNKTGGIKILDVVNELITNKIDNFYLGQITYTESASGKPAFKMSYSDDEGMEDMLTIVINFVLELVLWDGNGEAIDALINGVGEDGKPTKSTVDGIVNIIKGLAELDTDIDPETINWNYFTEQTVSVGDFTMPAKKFVYLDYTNDWNRDRAPALTDGLENLVDGVLELIGMTLDNGETATLDGLLEQYVNIDDLLNGDLLNKLLDLIAPLLYGENAFLGETLLDLIGLVLSVDLTTWNYSYRFENYAENTVYETDTETGLKFRNGTFTVGEGDEATEYTGKIFAIENAEDFAQGLAYIIKPAEHLLSWILLGKSYSFFVDNATGNERLIKIPGFNAYDTCLVLILEALGFENLKPAEYYIENSCESELIKDVIDSALGLVDSILADPIKVVLDLVPELIYFINSGALNACVTNLAGGLLTIIEYVNDSGLLGDEPIAIEGVELDENAIDTIINTLINEAIADKLGVDFDEEFIASDDYYEIGLSGLDIQTVIDLAEIFTGLELDSVIGYALDDFALGVKYEYTTVSTKYDEAYKMRFATAAEQAATPEVLNESYDLITIVLSLVIDALEYPANAQVLADLINGDKTEADDGYISAQLILDIVDLLQGWQSAELMNIEWFYPVDYVMADSGTTYTAYSDLSTEDIVNVLATATDVDVVMKTRTINYLSYASDWNYEKADYIADNFENIINAVLDLLGMGSIDVLLADVNLDSLTTLGNLEKIRDLIAGLTANLNDKLLSSIGILLGTGDGLASYDEMTFECADPDGKMTSAEFAAGLAKILAPVSPLLDWLLLGDDIKLFYDNDFYNGAADARDLVNLPGSYGYLYGLVPLLEALGVEDLPYIPVGSTFTEASLAQMLEKVVDRVNEILDNPVDEIVALLPNVLYFINANGIPAVLNNILAVALGEGDDSLLGKVNPLLKALNIDPIVIGDAVVCGWADDEHSEWIDLDVNGLLNTLLGDVLNGYELDITKLDLLEIFKLVEALTKDETGYLELTNVTGADKIDEFYLGKLEYFTSSNGKASFRMKATDDEDFADLITIIINWALEVILDKGTNEDGEEYDNLAWLMNKLGLDEDIEGIINNVILLVTGEWAPYEYASFDWDYFCDTETVLGDETVVPTSKYLYLEYSTDWTRAKVSALDDQLAALVDAVIGMIGGIEVGGETYTEIAALATDVVNGLLDEKVFKAELLNTILDTVRGFLYGDDAVLNVALVEVLDAVLGTELTDFAPGYVFADAVEGETYFTDDETGLEYKVVDGVINYMIADGDDFVSGLCMMLKSADLLLDFVFMGKDYKLFVDSANGEKILITVPGAYGYANGLAPLLEALGIDCPMAPDGTKTSDILEELLKNILARVEEILSDPVNEILNLIPELIYFINAGGLNVVVKNLLAVAWNIVDVYEAQVGEPVWVLEDLVGEEDFAIDSAIVNKLVNAFLTEAELDLGFEFKIEEINTEKLIIAIENIVNGLLAEKTGGNELTIRGALNRAMGDGYNYALAQFAIGTVSKYETASLNENNVGYKAAFGDGAEGGADRADLITMLITLVVDMLYVESNQKAIIGILNDGKDEADKLPETLIADILTVIKGYTYEAMNIDWFYFDDTFTYSESEKLELVPSINYLSYASFWSEDLADYIDDNLDAIIGDVLNLLGKGDTTVAQIVAGLFTVDSLYTPEIANTIKDLVVGLIGGLDTVITDLVNLIADVDLAAYNDMVFDETTVYDRETFAAAMNEVLAPAAPILDWLLFGDSLNFFDKRTADGIQVLINLEGFDGYAAGLVPLLEALGVTLPTLDKTDSATYTAAYQIGVVVDAVLARAEEILADPVNEVLALIPNIIYFINANGLAASVNNLLGAVLAIAENADVKGLLTAFGVDALDEALGDEAFDINAILNYYVNDALNLTGEDAIELDIENIDLLVILGVVEKITGLKIIEVTGEEKIDKFFLGQIEYFESANNQPAFEMVYSEDVNKDRADLLTVIINWLLEVAMYGDNPAAIDELVGLDGLVETIVSAIETLGSEVVPGDYHWNYFNEDSDDEYVEFTIAPVPPVTPFNNHLTYASDWTQTFADKLYDNVDDIITGVLTAIAGDDETKNKSVSDIINKSFNLYQAEYLNAILDLIKKLYDLGLSDTLLELAGLVLDVDLSAWDGLEFSDAEIVDADTFRQGLCEIIAPIYSVLDWLLNGDEIGFFVDNETGEKTLITIGGANGYINSIVPLLIALGVDTAKLPEWTEETKCADIIDETGLTFFETVIDVVLERVDAILADPVDEALDLLPGLLYFINANGLNTFIYNLLGGVLNAASVLFENGVITLEYDGVTYATVESYLQAYVGLNLGNLDLEGVIGFLESSGLIDLHGLELNAPFMGTYEVNGSEVTFTPGMGADAINVLEKFYLGDILGVSYSGYQYWKMVTKTGDGRGDIFTMLLSIVLDVLFYDGNEDACAEIIGGLLKKDDFTAEDYAALKALLMSGVEAEDASFIAANWVYYLGLTGDELEDEIAAVLGGKADLAFETLQERTVHYLEYDNNWNTDIANYLDENLVSIVDMVVNMIDGDYADLSELLEDKVYIYTDDTANMLIGKIAGLLNKLYDLIGEEATGLALDTVGELLGVDIEALCEPVTGVYNKATFVAAISDRLNNLDTLLDWLLFGRDYTLFTQMTDGTTPMIVLKGGNGYKNGLAPILEALGVDTHITADSVKNGALTEVISNLCDRIDEILYAGNTVEEALDLLPELIYFINTGALGVCINNLLAPIDGLLEVVEDRTGALGGKKSVNDLVTAIDLEHIDFDFLFDLVWQKAGIRITYHDAESAYTAEEMLPGDYIKTFYLGMLEYYESYGDMGAFRMVYTDDNTKIDMITILITLVLDVVCDEANADKLVEILSGLTDGDEAKARTYYNTILALLTDGVKGGLEYQKFDWFLTEYAGTGVAINPVALGTSMFNSVYGPLYTREMGEYISTYLVDFINVWLELLGVQFEGGISVSSINELISSLIGGSIYRQEYINKIYDLIPSLLETLYELIGEDLYGEVAEVLSLADLVDLSYWETMVVPTVATGDRDGFIKAICDILTPAEPLLEWLLTGKEIAFFNKDDNVSGTVTNKGDTIEGNSYIVLPGAEGYRYGLVPLLEALNYGDKTGIPTQAEYEASINAAATNEEKAEAMFSPILNQVADLIDEAIDDPVNTILALLPELIYFINSNGLDTCVKNLLHAVYSLLTAIDPIIADVEGLHQADGTVDLLALIEINGSKLDLREWHLTEINFNSIFQMIAGENDLVVNIGDATLKISGSTVIDLVSELAIGYIESYDSNINAGEEYFQDMYRMGYTTDVNPEAESGDKTDMVTIILRLLLKLVSDNPDFIKALLKDSLSGDGYRLLCSLIDNFAQMSSTNEGMDKIMYTVYYIFYGLFVGGVATDDWMAETNENYSYLYNLFATSNNSALKSLGYQLGLLFDQIVPEDIATHDEIAPNGFIGFFQKIIDFFKKIVEFFQNIFK